MREDTTLGTTWQKRFKGWHHLPLYLQLCILPFSSNLNVSFVLTGAGARARACGLISPSSGESELLSSLCIFFAEAAAVATETQIWKGRALGREDCTKKKKAN